MSSKPTSILGDSLGKLSDLMSVSKTPDGKPKQLALDRVQPDPDQPREEFDEIPLKELAASIELYGVLQPISVRPMNEQGIYIIKHGERRWRASCLAKGVNNIPAYIDEGIDSSYEQMIENIQREALKPMEIGKWCRKRMEAGEKGKDIAKRLGKLESFVSMHVKLPNLPPFIMSLYVKNIVRSPRVLVELLRACKLDEDATARFCAEVHTQGGTSKREVNALITELLATATQAQSPRDGVKDIIDNDKTSGGLEHTQATSTDMTGSVTPSSKPADINVIKRPKVLIGIVHGDKTGELVLTKRAPRGKVYVIFDNDEALLEADQIHVIGITER